MLVGPTATGKSTIMNRVAELDRDFGRVSGFTTRAKRANDEAGLYRYLTTEEAKQIINSDQVVQYALNPANGQIYGTDIGDYRHPFNMKDTLSGAVAGYRKLPFKAHRTISVTVPTDAWIGWLDTRHPKGSPERKTRLLEAKQSIEWSLEQHVEHSWIVNRPNDVTSAALELINSVRSGIVSDCPDEVTIMLSRIDDLLSYE